eukprot:gene8131-biopygen70
MLHRQLESLNGRGGGSQPAARRKRQRTRTGRGPDAGRTMEFEETDAGRTRRGRFSRGGSRPEEGRLEVGWGKVGWGSVRPKTIGRNGQARVRSASGPRPFLQILSCVPRPVPRPVRVRCRFP